MLTFQSLYSYVGHSFAAGNHDDRHAVRDLRAPERGRPRDTRALAGAAQLRSLRGGPGGVLPLLQLDGCPTPAFAVNASSIPSPSARYYPMCEYAQLDELAEAFVR